MEGKVYHVVRVTGDPGIDKGWEGGGWAAVEVLWVDNFLSDSSCHRPRVRLRLVHDGKAFYGIFRVEDRYVRSVHTGFQASVCLDSCVEFFTSPDLAGGYLNFEFNCGGSLLCFHVEDSTRTPEGFAKAAPVPDAELGMVKIHHTLPRVVEPEIQSPTTWELGFSIPFAIFAGKFKNVDINSGARWRANFFKCADATSHPHWATWAPVPIKNFHLPECFGEIVLG